MINVSSRQWTALIKMMDQFDKWDFDTLTYSENLGESVLIHFGFKLFQSYGLCDKFSISEPNLVSLLNSIKASTYEQNSYHNVTKVIELTRNFHYFT